MNVYSSFLVGAQEINPIDTTSILINNSDSLLKNDNEIQNEISIKRTREDNKLDSNEKTDSSVHTVVAKKNKKQKKVDTTHYSPKKAALWALACPGLGQIYMKKYWKLPIVYGIMGTVIYFVASNAKSLKQYNGYIRNYYDSIPIPSPYDLLGIEGLESYQNLYRRNVQLASFGTLFAWGLSIVDAVVDAHLHSFDISDNLSLKIHPKINTINNQYYTGIALNLAFK